MKLGVVLVGLFSLCAAGAIPLDFQKDEEGQNADDQFQALNATGAHARNGAQNAYWLFTRQNRQNRQNLIHNNAASVRNSHYRANRGTVVVVHGWNNNGNSEVNEFIRTAFLDSMDVNVIVVDWHRAANGPYNTGASPSVPSVGNHLGDFLNFLVNTGGGNFAQFHLVGHSLGAHIVGVAGRRLGGRVSRVSGMDPAGPRWRAGEPQHRDRLTSNAGRYVEAIHSDGRVSGINIQSGNADFYPNGGTHQQPGCATPICSHGRAFKFFASSVRNPNRFLANRCNDLAQANRQQCSGGTVQMGNGVFNKNANGIFGMRTTANWPFF